MLPSMRRWPTGRRYGFAPAWWRLPSLWRGRGTRQAEDQERNRQRGQIGIVQHETKARRRQRNRNQHDRRRRQAGKRRRRRGETEYRVIEQENGALEALSGEGMRARLARQI